MLYMSEKRDETFINGGACGGRLETVMPLDALPPPPLSVTYQTHTHTHTERLGIKLNMVQFAVYNLN